MITRFERTHEKLWSRTASGRCPLVESFHITFWLGNLLFFIQKNIGFSFKMMDITQTVNDDAKVNVISWLHQTNGRVLLLSTCFYKNEKTKKIQIFFINFNKNKTIIYLLLEKQFALVSHQQFCHFALAFYARPIRVVFQLSLWWRNTFFYFSQIFLVFSFWVF